MSSTRTLQIDTETFADGYDFDDFVRRLLRSEAGGYLPSDNGPLSWIRRAMTTLAGSPFEAPFFVAVSRCLTDPSPAVRLEALRIFESYPSAPGAERVTELARDDRSLFSREEQDDLHWQLLRVVGARMTRGDEVAKQLGRIEALGPEGRPEPLIAALTSHDPDWVIAHAAQIVAAHPETGSTIRYNLESLGRDLSKLAPLL